MASSSRRATRRPEAQGFVNWNSLDFSESDEKTPPKFGQRLRRRAAPDSDESADSEREVQSSAEEGGSEAEASQPVGRRSLRLTLKKEENVAGSDFGGDVSDDSDVYQSTKRRKMRSTKDTRPGRKGRPTSKTEDDTDTYRPVGARRSERTRTQPRRNMRERHEDEISAHSEEEIGPKIVATKEYFEKFAPEHEFRVRHRERCDTCGVEGDTGEKGPLIFCQGCTSSYHKVCLGNRGTREHLVTKVAEGQFVLQCRRCLGMAQRKDPTAPHHGVCLECRGPGSVSKAFRPRLTTREEQLRREEHGGIDPITVVDPSLINSPSNVMFRCANCQRAWHMQHLPRRGPTQDEDDGAALGEQELADLRFDYYSRSWTCKDCIEHNSLIDTLVAWRPSDLDKYIPGSTVDMIEEAQKEYLIKWKAQSYFRTTWMPGAWVWGVVASAMRSAFMKKPENQMPKMTTEDAIPEDWLRVDIVFDVIYTSVVSNRTKEIDFARAKEVDSAYVKYKGLGYEDAIWERPPSYEEKDRWADFKTAYDDWVLKHYVHTPNQTTLRRNILNAKNKDFETQLLKNAQPSTVTGGQLMDYQVEGMNWLYYQWYKAQNCILADEMGLGKTIQLIAYFALMVKDHKCWPFLVVVPNSTCPNWRREIKKWAPSLRAVTYYGSSVARKIAQDYELFPKDEEERERAKNAPHDKSQPKDLRAHIVITSYESAIEEKARQNLAKVPWAGLVVDEGQRLKNEKNLLYENLSKMKFPFKALLTGTPLQNNARELFNLLQFLDPKFNAAAMDAKYETLTKENVPELHEMIRPFFLRRTKVQVLTFLPPMAQIILPVTMSVVQKKLYKSILAKNPQLMKSIFSRNGNVAQKDRHNLNNILMQLRKTLCHPFVYSRKIEERSYELAVSHRNLVEASSKLQLLQIMLPKLQERGHRVLIFSQFLDNLDIVEDFLDGLGLQHRRLDGSINSLEKQKRIDDFNAPDSPYFAFLLSTRAGGVGINLATADTVIIMDPDFNPHQDIQALSRAHRIGQKNKVLVFQMMTRGSAEEKIMQIGKKKMVLDHVLVQQMDQEDEAGMDLESVLRHGAQALFDDDNTGDIMYDSASVDKLLDRSQIESTGTGEDKSAESQFSFARVWANDKAALEDNLGESGVATPTDTTVWDKILKERERLYAEEAAARAETLGRGKRKRNVSILTNLGGLADHDRRWTTKLKMRWTLNSIPPPSSLAMTAVTPTSRLKVPKVMLAKIPLKPKTPIQTPRRTWPQGKLHPSSPRSKVKKTHVNRLKRTMSNKAPARPFKRVKIPTGNPPYADAESAANYVPIGGLPPTHHCMACGDNHPMGWCRLKLAGVEHCGLCGLAHIGHGRTCPHLNSEVQVATLLGTLKESTESHDLIEKATKYLRMIRGDLVQRKRMQERKQETSQNRSEHSGYRRPDPIRIDGNADPRPVVNGMRDPADQWRNALAWSRAHGLQPPRPVDTVER
jgi:chromodomain-helicase-DNA-binding protein 4